MMKDYTKKQTIKLVQEFIVTNNMDITLDEIQKIIYESKEHNELLQLWMMLCEKAWLGLNQVQIDLVMNCWNNFPHKELWWKAPKEMRA